MLRIRSLNRTQLETELASCSGLRIQTGPFRFAIHSTLREVTDGLMLLYGEHSLLKAEASAFVDFHVAADRPRGIRRYIRPQAEFTLDDHRPFEPLPGDQGFPMLEWGMNWAISGHAHQYVILHAAVLERDGRAVVMPAPSGSGKSTLCAALAWNGWRLLSDELALLDPGTGLIWPLARPISLKNRSIDIMREWIPEARLSRTVQDTVKGAVAHLEVPAEAVHRVAEPARPGWVIFPRWQAETEAQLDDFPRARAFMAAQSNCFNYHLHGRSGFDALARLITQSRCHEFRYSRLEDALTVFASLPPPP